MQLHVSTWPEIEAYLAGSKAILIPIGSTEQHGPIGLIGTDASTAQAVAHGLGERARVLVAPTLSLGVAQFNLAFPGTISVRATTLMATVEDLVLSLTAQGFRHFYFVNGHGGNVAPVRAAFQDIYARWSLGERSGTAPRCRLRSWWEYPAADALRRTLYGAAEGMHATPSEVAITRHCDPQAFAAQTGAPDGAPLPPPEPLSSAFLRDHGGDNHWDARAHRDAFPDGRVGSDSSLARAADGEALLELAISGAVDDYRAFLAEA